MSVPIPLYPLRFEPIFQYRLWGGRRLTHWLSAPLPGDGPVGEAWLLSDREDHPSLVSEGPLQGWPIGKLFHEAQEQLMGNLTGQFHRFPLLLKFLDAHETLSIQVHPSDKQTRYLPPGESGKTEAWVVLEAEPESRIYAGLQPGTTSDDLRRAVASGTVVDRLASFTPQVGDGVLVTAGTVHSLGGVVVLEVQENSDVTFRLFDWGHVDATTGQPRPLQTALAMACVTFPQGPVNKVTPVIEETPCGPRERLFLCEHFGMWRTLSDSPFQVGAKGVPRLLVCLAGHGELEHNGISYTMSNGDVLLLPAVAGALLFRPLGNVHLVEISLPEGSPAA